MSDFWVITWTSGGFQILHDYNLILGNCLYLIQSLLRRAVIRVLPALWSVCRQGETTEGCVCVVSILLPTVLSWYFIWSMLIEQGAAFPVSSGIAGLPCPGGTEIGGIEKGGLHNQMWGTSPVEGEHSQKPDYQVYVCAWIILVYIRWLSTLWSSCVPSHLSLCFHLGEAQQAEHRYCQ